MDDPDYEAIVDRIRTHSAEAPGSDTERATIRTLDSADVEALHELRDAIDDAAAGNLEFVLPERIADEVGDGEDGDAEGLADRLGTPVRTEAGMPDDAILLLDPDAVDDGELRSPAAIALGTLQRTAE